MWGRIYPHVVLLIFANTIFKVSCKGNGSLTFLIDDTSTMTDDIDQVRKSVDKITSIVIHEKSSLIDNMVLVTFNDPGVYDRIVTRDPEEFKNALALVEPHNEAKPPELDCWEPSMKGLLLALNKSKDNSYVFVFTDAPAKDYIDGQYVIEMCQKKQTQIVFVLSGRFCKKFPYIVPEARNVYFDIAVACSGLAIFVKKDEVEKVFGPIEEIIKGNKAVITAATVPAGVSKNISFTTDDYTDYVIVSASGKDVTLKINDPSVSVKEIMTTNNAIVVKLSNIKPGNYVATVKGKTNTSVVITGRTDFFFSHGFSELKPKSLRDTSPQPNSDAKGYLSLSVNDDNHSIRIDAAEILDMDGKPIIEKLPLTEISKNFYITDPFVAPSQRFRVAVEGIVIATNKPIKRTAKIPVSPPPLPKTAPKVQQGVTVLKVTEGKTAVFECKVVSGFPAPKITWLFWGKSGSKYTPLIGSESVLRITKVKDIHGGKYKCVAENPAGKDDHVTTLFVQVRPKILSNVSNIYESTEVDALLRIPCVSAGLPEPSITWKLNGLVIHPSAKYSIENGALVIREPKVSDTNSYTCEAKNEVGAVSATFRTNISQAPQVSSVTNMKVRIGTPASIECTVVKGEPKPTITWQFMDNSGSNSTIPGSDKVLNISMVENKHAGRYKCVAKNKVGSNEHITTLEVQDPPKIFSIVSNIYESTEGDALLKIPCVADGLPKPSITWKLNGLVIHPSARYSIENGALVIRDPKVSDTNSYTCEAKNEVGAVSATFRTNINQAPQVSGVPNKKVRIGTPASIECMVVKGEPKPTITWQFMDNSDSNSTIHGSDKVLNISMVENKHAGRYKCVAKNKVGSNEHITTLEVQAPPKIFSIVSNIYESTEGDALLKIPCVAAGLPKPSITWKLNNLVIHPSARYSIENGALVIRDPKVSDTNSYTCEAKNEVGAVSATFRTYINQAPQVSGVPNKKVRIGTPASIECTVIKGEPKPTITWQFMDNSGSNSTIPGSDKVLHISMVENKHAGRYKCVAKNKVGSNEHITTLEVQAPPKIFSSVSNIYESTEGDALLKIPCVSAGLPKPSITWKLNGLVIHPSARYSIKNGALVIRDPKVSDTNSYSCEAKNEVGAVSVTFRTYINQAPQVSGVPNKKVKIGTPASIECMVIKGEPKPTITWQFMDNSGSNSPILGSDKVLHISKVENKHAGRYKCVAKNKVGNNEHITTLIVESLPKITTKSTTVEGIEGDLALRIPCDVVGIPQPVVTWKINGTEITPDGKYSIENGALVIVKPAESDSSLYTCEAKNYVGSVSTTFQAVVEKHPKTFGTKHNVYLLQHETRKLKCEAYISEYQSVRWFEAKVIPQILDSSSTTSPPELDSSETTKTSSIDYSSTTTSPTITLNENITKPYIRIVNASYLDDGNYTCRVSDKHGNTHTHTYVVVVGTAPEFLYNAHFPSDWRGDISDITRNCDIHDNAKPTPVVEWTLNGKRLTDFNSAGLGHYTCNVSNALGSIQKRFDIKSSACLITRNLRDAHYMPLVLNDKGIWHKWENTKHYTVVAQDEKITLSCPSQKKTSNSFIKFPKKSTVEAFCYKEDSFIVEGNSYKLSDLQCTNSVQPSVIRKKVKCSTETSELMRVGYNVPGFLQAYEVCFDTEKNMPLYTRIIMTEHNNIGLSAGYNWYTYPGVGYEKTYRGFTCNDTTSSCCYSKSQLVNAKDFNDGPAKRSTFIDPLNVVPVWLPCDTSMPTWETVNNNIRSMMELYNEIITWSGTHTLQTINGAIIPRYLWKVVWYDNGEGIAIVHVNDPSPTEKDIKCEDICDKYSDWIEFKDKYTYCCSLTEFFEVFNIHNIDIEESLEAARAEINKKSD